MFVRACGVACGVCDMSVKTHITTAVNRAGSLQLPRLRWHLSHLEVEDAFVYVEYTHTRVCVCRGDILKSVRFVSLKTHRELSDEVNLQMPWT